MNIVPRTQLNWKILLLEMSQKVKRYTDNLAQAWIIKIQHNAVQSMQASNSMQRNTQSLTEINFDILPPKQ